MSSGEDLLTNTDEKYKSGVYFGYDPTKGQPWLFLAPAWSKIFFWVAIIGIFLTGGSAIVAGTNAFIGVTFMYRFAWGFTVLYLCLGSVTFLSIGLLIFANRNKVIQKVELAKPYQVRNQENTILLTFLIVFIITVIPLSIHGFKIGNMRAPCNSTQCDLEGLLSGNAAFVLLWFAGWYYYSIALELHEALNNSKIDVMYSDSSADVQAFYTILSRKTNKYNNVDGNNVR